MNQRSPLLGLFAAALLAPLGACKPPEPPPPDNQALIGRLCDPEPATRAKAARTLGERKAKEATPALAILLKDDSPEVRFSAGNALIALDVSDDDTARALLMATHDKINRVRVAAMMALERGDPSIVAPFASSMLHGLVDPESGVRLYTEKTFRTLGAGAEQALARGLNDSNPDIRQEAARILVPDPRGAMWGIIRRGLPHPNEFVRWSSATALGAMGPAAWPAKGALEKALEDESRQVRDAAAQALLDIDPAGEERRAAGPCRPKQTVTIGEILERFDGVPSMIAGSWPSFRGPRFDGCSTEEIPLARTWKDGDPRRFWSVPMVDGYSGAVVHGGRVYVLDYDPLGKREQLRCLSLDDGREIWRRSHRLKLINNTGYVHTMPAVSDRFAAVIGAMNHLMCVDSATGEFLWGRDLTSLGKHFENFFSVQSPLIDGSTVVLAAGAPDALLVGLDGATGDVLWKTPNPHGLGLSYSSVVPATLHGRKTYLYSASGGVAAVSAEPDSAGMLLWETLDWEPRLPIPTPVPLDGNRLFVTAGYNYGSALLLVPGPDANLVPRTLWRQETGEGLSCAAHTPVYLRGHLFGLLPDNAGRLKKQLVCADPEHGGRIVWSSGIQRRFGMYEPMICAQGNLYVLSSDGYLTVVRATPERYDELGRALILEGAHDWHPWMALAGGRLIVRDSKRLVCVDLTP